MTSHFSFNAQVSPEAIGKVGRLFNATIGDILNELLQNARRAGATKVVIDQIHNRVIVEGRGVGAVGGLGGGLTFIRPGTANESYARTDENAFVRASQEPLATFSIDSFSGA